MRPPQLFTYKDVTKLTGISTGALRKRLSTGTMPPPDLRHGGSPVWYHETLQPWLDKQRKDVTE